MLKLPLCLIYGIGLSAASAVPALAESILTLKPARCISLQQGQSCYQKVKVQWQLSAPANVCVFANDNSQPLMCWQNAAQAMFTWEFEGNKNAELKLINSDNQQVIAQQQLIVAWVYNANSRRESHWRLF